MNRNDRVANALRGILEIGKRDLSNQKYDAFFIEAADALAESAKGVTAEVAKRAFDAFINHRIDDSHEEDFPAQHLHQRMRAALESVLPADAGVMEDAARFRAYCAMTDHERPVLMVNGRWRFSGTVEPQYETLGEAIDSTCKGA